MTKDNEIIALKTIYEAIKPLTPEATERVFSYVRARKDSSPAEKAQHKHYIKPHIDIKPHIAGALPKRGRPKKIKPPEQIEEASAELYAHVEDKSHYPDNKFDNDDLEIPKSLKRSK